jgi:hypothetical protein
VKLGQHFFSGMPTAPLIAAVLDLESFGLLNEALGSRLSNVILDLISGALGTGFEALSDRCELPFWTTSFGDEHYFFTRPDTDQVADVIDDIELAVRNVSQTLSDRFAPVHLSVDGAGGLRHLPLALHAFLGQYRIISTTVSSGPRFEALAYLPADQDIHDHARTLDRAWGDPLSVVPHDLYHALGKDGRWRLPFPRIRLGLGVAASAGNVQSADDSLDFVLQELHWTMERARAANVMRMRRDMLIGMPAFRCAAHEDARLNTGSFASIRQMEKDIASGSTVVDEWQLILSKPRWSFQVASGGRVEMNSLKELISHSNPGFADRLLGIQRDAFVDHVAKAMGSCSPRPERWLCGASGNSLLLTVLRAPLPQEEIRQHLSNFSTSCALPGGANVSRIDALSFSGTGKDTLLQAIAWAQAYFPLIEWPSYRSEICIISVAETEMSAVGRTIAGHKAPALATYEKDARQDSRQGLIRDCLWPGYCADFRE